MVGCSFEPGLFFFLDTILNYNVVLFVCMHSLAIVTVEDHAVGHVDRSTVVVVCNNGVCRRDHIAVKICDCGSRDIESVASYSQKWTLTPSNSIITTTT